jgi:hypothetical protein
VLLESSPAQEAGELVDAVSTGPYGRSGYTQWREVPSAGAMTMPNRDSIFWPDSVTSTFPIADVPLATTPLPEVSLAERITALLQIGEGHHPFHDESPTPVTLEASSRPGAQYVAGTAMHPIIQALHWAFADHRPVILSPDMIWLLLCQGLATHVRVDPERWRKEFVAHEGARHVEVFQNDLERRNPDSPWDDAVERLSAAVREQLVPGTEVFRPTFSTTGTAERIAAEIVFLDAMGAYFSYGIATLCGIPAIGLEGTVNDWKLLAERAEEVARFDLEWWIGSLRPILAEFVAAAGGKANPAVWKSIFKWSEVSGGDCVTGWIVAFFPYLWKSDGDLERNPWLVDHADRRTVLFTAGTISPVREIEGGFHAQWVEGPGSDELPSSISRVSFVWHCLGDRLDMEFLGGFMGVAQLQPSLALRPEIGWAIREKKPLLPTRELGWTYGGEPVVTCMDWLLGSDPSIRWQVMRDLLDAAPEEVAAERARVATEGYGAELLGLQGQRDEWGRVAWSQDERSTVHALLLLRDLGLDPASGAARRAMERVRRKVTWKGCGPPECDGNRFFQGELEPCINAQVAAVGAYFGEDVSPLIDRLLSEQLEDGGWNCEVERGSTRSSFHTTICVLEAFLAHERQVGGSSRVAEARARGENYLLERRLHRRLSTGEIIQDRKTRGHFPWTDLGFPSKWRYDLLRGLDYLREAGIRPDSRMAEAVDLVAAKRDESGRWNVDFKHPYDTPVQIDYGVGAPNRWITLRALRVMRWWGA